MKIIGYTCVFNEEELVPIVMPYIEAFGYDKFIVLDNNSTDSTRELLSKYPFVEIRSYNTDGCFDVDTIRKLQIVSFLECKKMAESGELVWFTWTDFDEVLFYNADVDFRSILEGDYNNRGYNCYFKNMVNLFMPYELKDESPLKHMGNNRFVHSIPGIRANIWVGGMKPTMLAVNDFEGIKFFDGNHYCFAKTVEGRPIKSYDDACRLYGFHLKFIDKQLLLKKWESYADRGGYAGKEKHEELIKRFDTIFESQYSLSFPLSDYFLHDYFNSGLHSKTIPFNGIKEI